MVAKQQEKQMSHKYANEFYIDETNSEAGPVVRWNSNDRIPFEDMLTEFLNQGLIGALELNNSLVQRKIEDRLAIEAYCKNYRGPSDEERFEARAAFGPGAELVNVFTGHKWTT
jgi:hypothetical protein